MSRDIPPMLHAPHADDCPSVGGDGGVYRLLAETIPHWRKWLRGCNCGRYYPPIPPSPSTPNTKE